MKFLNKNNEAKWVSFRDWESRDFDPPSPVFVKRALMNRKGFRDSTWVETGTWKGDTALFLSHGANRVFTIEPDPSLFERAEERFRSNPKITCVKGTSEEVLSDICKKIIAGPVNFWLDGHYSAGKTHKGILDTPIKYELSVISKHISRLKSVCILIDDVRCFNPSNPLYSDYPDLNYLVQFAVECGLNWSIEHDIFIASTQP